jgi:type IV pilus assembly protein PilP
MREVYLPLRLVVATALVAALVGCSGDPGIADLREFVETAHAGRKPRVEPLPEIKTEEAFAYAAAELPDPFSAANLRPEPAVAADSGPRPDLNRRKEPLEEYPLDALKMVGTLERGGKAWVVVRAPDGTVHRAAVGNHIGKNFGTIRSISDDRVEIVELIQGALGNWIEREASLALPES